MGVELLFNATCTIQRRQYTTTRDAWGQDTGKYTYANLATSVKCRIEGLRFEEVVEQREAIAVTHRVFLPPKQDVVQTDRVTSVVTEEGDAVGSTYEVRYVDDRPGGTGNHVEALLMEIK